MLVRKMTASDLPEVALLEKDNFSQPWSENAFATAMESADNVLIVAEEEEQIVGYICMYVVCGEGEITNVAVDSMQRNKGVAKKMLEYIFEESRSGAVSRIVLEVRVSNKAAICLYKGMGFVELGIRKGFYDMPKEDAIIMEFSL